MAQSSERRAILALSSQRSLHPSPWKEPQTTWGPPGGVAQAPLLLVAIWQTTANSGLPAEEGWKFGLEQIAGEICNHLANGPFCRGKLHSVKLQRFSWVDKTSFICWSKPLWVCDMRRLRRARGRGWRGKGEKKKLLVWFQRAFADKVVQTRSLTEEKELLSE